MSSNYGGGPTAIECTTAIAFVASFFILFFVAT
jgi:hypothetical protein